jgi:cystathionine beta-lyase/cystathionine gamma-synthase
VAFATGMAAISAVILSLTSADSELVVSDEIYREVPELYENLLRAKRLAAVHVVDILDTEAVIEKLKNDNVKMLYLETASNPNMKIPDFEALVAGARKVNPNCLIVVDNTLLTPILFRPFEVRLKNSIPSREFGDLTSRSNLSLDLLSFLVGYRYCC